MRLPLKYDKQHCKIQFQDIIYQIAMVGCKSSPVRALWILYSPFKDYFLRVCTLVASSINEGIDSYCFISNILSLPWGKQAKKNCWYSQIALAIVSLINQCLPNKKEWRDGHFMQFHSLGYLLLCLINISWGLTV